MSAEVTVRQCRAQGPSLYLMGNCHDSTVTGNTFPRSGAILERSAELAEVDRCHARLEGVDGLMFTGNGMELAKNDAKMQRAPP